MVKTYQFTDTISSLNTSHEVLFEKKMRTSTIKRSKIFDEQSQIRFFSQITAPTLDLRVFFFNKITLIGNTDALIFNKQLYHQELNELKTYHSMKNRKIFVKFDRLLKKTISIETTPSKIYSAPKSLYISLLKEHSINYYHFVTENIPRLLLILKILQSKNNAHFLKEYTLTLLIDAHMPLQCIEIIRTMMPCKYSILFVEKGQRITCKKLIYCSPFWQSIDNIRGELDCQEFFIDTYALNLFYSFIRTKITTIPTTKPYRRIYLRRHSTQIRSITNLLEVEQFMLDNQFEIVETGTLSFLEQVRLLSETSLVIGATGAYFTNLLFMQPHTKAIIFYPNHPSINYGIFQPLADVAKVNLIYFHVTQVATNKRLDNTIHSDFYVDLSRLTNLLKVL